MSIIYDLERISANNLRKHQLTLQARDTRNVAKAYKAVVNATLVDVFCLQDEESLWVNYHLDKVIEMTKDADIKSLPVAVEDELETGIYSKTLFLGNTPSPTVSNTDIPQASLEDWTAIFTDMIAEGYRLNSISQAGISAIISTMLSELGVGDTTTPRGARYLPNTIRWRLNHR